MDASLQGSHSSAASASRASRAGMHTASRTVVVDDVLVQGSIEQVLGFAVLFTCN